MDRGCDVKIKLLTLLLVLSITSGVTAEERMGFYTLLMAPKGQNSHISDYFTPREQASETLNVRVNDKYMALAKRSAMTIYGQPESSAITGLYRYYTSDVNKYLIVGSTTKLWVGNDGNGTFQQIGQGFTEGQRWTFANFQDVLIAANGAEYPIKYDGNLSVTANTDGHRTAGDLVADLGAPFAELNTGANLDAEKWYQYKVAYYDGANYYYSNSRSNPIKTGATVNDVTLTGIPLGPVGTTTRYIFRTEGQADRTTLVGLGNSGYKLVGSIANNTAKTYNDAVADGSLTTAYDSWISSNGAFEVTPPKGQYLLIHRERLWTARTPTEKSTAFYTPVSRLEYFDPNAYFDIRADDGDEITGITEFLGILTVFKTRTIQKIYTDQPSDSYWSVSAPFSFIGTPSPHSIAATPEGIYYYGREGIYKFTGQNSQLISDAVTDEIRDILESNAENIVGFYYKNEYHFSYTSEELGGTHNNRVLVYDIVRDAYVKDSKNINVFAALNSGTDFGVLYSGDSSGNGNVYINETTTDLLLKRYKSEIQAGTYDDTRSSGALNDGHPHLPTGTEKNSTIELSWDYTIDTWDAAGATIDDLRSVYTSAIIDRPDTSGTWTSEIYKIDAVYATKLVWNENLGQYGDVTWDIRFCDDAACSGESFTTGFTNPAGSDLTALTANTWVQLRANLSTSNIQYTPNLFVKNGYMFKLFYNKSGANRESSFLSVFDSGWKDLENPYAEKHLWRIDVYYSGSIGTINVQYKNIEGDVDKNFDIDLEMDPEADIRDEYIGTEEGKIYRHWTGMNTADDPSAIGMDWKFIVTDESNDSDFKVHKIELQYFTQEVPR